MTDKTKIYCQCSWRSHIVCFEYNYLGSYGVFWVLLLSCEGRWTVFRTQKRVVVWKCLSLSTRNLHQPVHESRSLVLFLLTPHLSVPSPSIRRTIMGIFCCFPDPIDFDGEVTLFHFEMHRAVGRGAFGKVCWICCYNSPCSIADLRFQC